VSDFILFWPVLFAPSIWILVTFIISRVGGWSLLAKAYLAQANTLDGESWRFQSIQMRWATNYGNCVTVRANPLGLGLSVLWLLRIAHPPLLIPWSDITIHRVRRNRFFPSLIEFRFRLQPSVPIRVNNKLFSKILDSSDKYYPDFRRISPPVESHSSTRIKRTVQEGRNFMLWWREMTGIS
jgi:hypothetical protein